MFVVVVLVVVVVRNDGGLYPHMAPTARPQRKQTVFMCGVFLLSLLRIYQRQKKNHHQQQQQLKKKNELALLFVNTGRCNAANGVDLF